MLASDYERAHFHYMLYCQGCHTADGMGTENAVPQLKDQIGYIVQVQAGREYLVQVPGSANSVLSDEDLATVLNWMVNEFAGESLPDRAKPYTASEVGKLRKTPITEIESTRSQVIEAIGKELNKTIK